MSQLALTKNELQLLQRIRNSTDPSKALQIAVDILQRMLAGETPDSIMESYGLGDEWKKYEKVGDSMYE